MFDVAPTEFLLVAIVALIVIGPKDLPRVMRVVGQWVGKARGVARHFRSGFDTMVREAELEEMEARWKSENARIMREHPADPAPELSDAPMMPLAHPPGEGESTPPSPESTPASSEITPVSPPSNPRPLP